MVQSGPTPSVWQPTGGRDTTTLEVTAEKRGF